MERNVLIEVDKIYKDFILPHEKRDTLKSVFTQIHKVNKTKNTNFHALRDISFKVNEGDFFGIVGRNGSGKSTLLKILAGIYQPTSGRVRIVGRLVPFIELGVGFNQELTGKENVYLNGALLGFSKTEVDEMYDSIVSFAELQEFMDQKLKNYSSGMQVRLAFSMAVRAEADILLVDEVLAVGDEDFQRKCYDYFKKLKRDKKTVVFVSHDMNAVREFCDKVILVEDSRIISSGKANTVAGRYSRLFLEEGSGSEAEEETNEDHKKRWGNKKISIQEIILSDKVITDNSKELTIQVKLLVNKDSTDMVAGFVIKNGEGEAICGTNTQLKQILLKNLKKGETWDIFFTCPNIFSDGKHTIDIAIHETDGVTAADWWEEASTFRVKRLGKTGYKVAPPIDIDIKKE